MIELCFGRKDGQIDDENKIVADWLLASEATNNAKTAHCESNESGKSYDVKYSNPIWNTQNINIGVQYSAITTTENIMTSAKSASDCQM